MKKVFKWIILTVCLLAAGWMFGLYITGDNKRPVLWNGASMVDDWYAVEKINDNTYIIAEPKYWQYNIEYLILGNSRAILFDTGSGRRPIMNVVRKFTNLPVTAICSHWHFDHTGNIHEFSSVGLPDLPDIRDDIDSKGVFSPELKQRLWISAPNVKKGIMLKPYSTIDLGGRTLTVIPAAGHSEDSIALYDKDNRILFTGDFIYPAGLVLYTPGADMRDCRATTKRLLATTDEETKLLCAHNGPKMERKALADLDGTLDAIRKGQLKPENDFPFKRYNASKNFSLLTF